MNTSKIKELNDILNNFACEIIISKDPLGFLFNVFNQGFFIGAFYWDNIQQAWLAHPEKGDRLFCESEFQAVKYILSLYSKLLPQITYNSIPYYDVAQLSYLRSECVNAYNACIMSKQDPDLTIEENENCRINNLAFYKAEIEKCDAIYEEWYANFTFKKSLREFIFLDVN